MLMYFYQIILLWLLFAGLFTPNSGNAQTIAGAASNHNPDSTKVGWFQWGAGTLKADMVWRSQPYQNDFTPNYFTRLGYNQQLNFFDIPIRMDMLISSENSSINRVNHFTIDFDQQALLSKIQNKRKEKEKFFKNKLSISNYELEKCSSEIRAKVDKRDKYKSRLKELEDEERIIQDSIKQVNNLAKNIVGHSGSDSVTKKKQALEAKLDFIYQRKKEFTINVDKWNEELSRLNQLNLSISQQSKYDSLMGLLNSEDKEVRNQAKHALKKYNHSMEGFNDINLEKLSLGTISPNYSELSLNNITINGAEVELTKGRWQFGMMGGIGSSNRGFIDPRTISSFQLNQYLGGVQFGYQNKNVSVRMFNLIGESKFRNMPSMDSKTTPFINAVQSVLLEFKPIESLSIELETANSGNYSNFAELTNQLINNYKSGSRYAFRGKMVFNGIRTVVLSGSFKQINSDFNNNLSSFIRNNSRIFDFTIEKSFFTFIKAKLSYRLNQFGIGEIDNNYSKSQNLFYSLQTKFKRLPNLSISFNPNVQEVVRNSSIFLIENTVLNCRLSHLYRRNKYQVTSSLNYSKINTIMDSVNLQLNQYSLIFSGNKTGLGSISFNYLVSSSNKLEDSISFSQIGLTTSIQLNKRLTLNSNSTYSFLKAGYRVHASILVSAKLADRISINLGLGIQQIEAVLKQKVTELRVGAVLRVNRTTH